MDRTLEQIKKTVLSYAGLKSNFSYLKPSAQFDEHAGLFVPHQYEAIVSLNHQVNPHGTDLEGNLNTRVLLDDLVFSFCQYQLIVLQI